MRRWAITLISLLLAESACAAEIFRWTDEQGELHFAQSIDQIPPRHRVQALSQKQEQHVGNFQIFTGSTRLESASTHPAAEIRVPFERDTNLMVVTALVNGHLEVPFYIDTGASGISLPAAVVEQLGIVVGPNTQYVSVTTAGGQIAVPLVKLESVRLGDAEVENLLATVNPSLNIGLLGGSFFNHYNYRVDHTGNFIALVYDRRNRAPEAFETQWRERFRAIREPLDELEAYLQRRQLTDHARVAELEGKREQLRERLVELEREANRDAVPTAWRH